MKVSLTFFEQAIREGLNLGHRARPSTITAETELKLQVGENLTLLGDS